MKPISKKNFPLYTASFVATLIMFHVFYELAVLDPTNVSWLMTARHDWGTHYLGWLFYRHEPWQWPLGQMKHYYYPLGTNVGFTDNIPLLDIFFKLFTSWLPADFQYFGIWLLSCHLLAAWYTIRLFRLFKVNDLYTFLAVLFIVANPVLVYRGLHPALCAHWLLLASIYNYFRYPAIDGVRRILRSQFILLALSSLISPYLCFMVLGFVFIIPIKMYYYDKAISRKTGLVFIAGCSVFIMAVWIITGMFAFSRKESLNVDGAYGLYSLNLNAPFNSFGWSSIFPQLKQVTWHQYEGFVYPGAGIYLLVLVLLIYWLLKVFTRRRHDDATLVNTTPGSTTPERGARKTTGWFGKNRYLIPLFLLAIFYTLFAITHVVTLNDKVLFKVPIPDFVKMAGDTLRSSARFFWAPYYLILLAVILAVTRLRIPASWRRLVLLFALFLQVYDTKGLLTSRHLSYGEYGAPLDPAWWQLIEHSSEVILYPPFQPTYVNHMDYQDFCYLAGKTSKPITTGYVGRIDNNAAAAYNDSLLNDLQEARVTDALYITNTANLPTFSAILAEKKLRLHQLDGYYFMSRAADPGGVLSGLADSIDARNKPHLDSVIRSVAPNAYKELATPGEMDQRKMTFYIEKLVRGRTYLYLHGWSVIENRNDNKGDSLYSILLSGNKTYIAPTQVTPRPDITAHFKAAYLDDAGFEGVISINGVDSGTYRLAIGIKPREGRIQYQVTDSVIRINATARSY